MRFDRLTIPARDPTALGEWYGSLFDAEPTGKRDDRTSTVTLGETTLQVAAVESTPTLHVAVRLHCDPETAREWLADRTTILPVEGETSRYFEFLDATAIYFEDPEGNVLEALCYAGDPRSETDSTAEWIDGVTEVGLPAREPLALVEWLEEEVGLSAWGSPSETFGWVGDSNARFVVVPADRPWYPTDRIAGTTPISVTLHAESAQPGRHTHPKLPYEITVTQHKK